MRRFENGSSEVTKRIATKWIKPSRLVFVERVHIAPSRSFQEIGSRMVCCEVLCELVVFVARFILFFASFLLFAFAREWGSLGLDLMVTKEVSNVDLTENNLVMLGRLDLFATGLLIVSACLFMLAIYAIYVSFKTTRPGVKRLLWISQFLSASCVLVLLFSGTSIVEFKRETLARLEAYQSEYLWDFSGDGGDRMIAKMGGSRQEATIFWDIMQENLHCCGVESPQDWAKFRPTSESFRDALPISCCQDVEMADVRGNGLCRNHLHYWPDGCGPVLKKTIDDLFGLIASTAFYNLAFVALACVILICSPRDQLGQPMYSASAHEFISSPASSRLEHYYPHLPPPYQAVVSHAKYGSY